MHEQYLNFLAIIQNNLTLDKDRKQKLKASHGDYYDWIHDKQNDYDIIHGGGMAKNIVIIGGELLDYPQDGMLKEMVMKQKFSKE